MPLKVKHTFVSGKPDVGGSDKVQASHWNADHVITDGATGVPIIGTLTPVGTIIDYAGHTVPPGWLECAGQGVLVAACPALFAALVKYSDIVTISPGSPAVISWANHGLRPTDTVQFESSGPFPPEIVAGAKYYISGIGFTANSFSITSVYEGAPVNTTAPTGTFSCYHAPWGWPSGDVFHVPDLRESVTAGLSYMGAGAPSDWMPDNFSMGEWIGEEYTPLSIAHMPAHAHGSWTYGPDVTHTHALNGTGTGSGTTDSGGGIHAHGLSLDKWNNAQGGGGHTVLQPDGESGSSGTFTKSTNPDNATHTHNFSVSVSLIGSSGVDERPHYHGIPVEGSNTPHPNMQPTTFVRKIIYAGT